LWVVDTWARRTLAPIIRDEPGHQELCDSEQAYFLRAIHEDFDLTEHLEDAVNSLRIVLAADESFRTGQVVQL